MTEYQRLMNLSDMEERKAIDFARNGNNDMAIFHKNVSVVFKERARNLPMLRSEMK